MTDYTGVERRKDHVHVQLGQYGAMLATAAFCLFLILGVLAYGIINTNNRARDVQDRQVRVAACILEQIAEHRIASQNHHVSSSKAHKQEYVLPDGVLPPPFDPDSTICREFFPTSEDVKEVTE